MLRLVLGIAAAALLGAQPDPSAILTPRPGPAPRINGAKVYGARPGKPFVYRMPCTGERPMRFRAAGLPQGLTLEESSGVIRGTTPAKPGDYRVQFEARNRHGAAKRDFKIVVGDTLALTPPMGWNDWYTHYEAISDADMRAAADAMIASGMADAGYSYVSIDDCWMRKPGSTDARTAGPVRDGDGAILPNTDFPDMRGMTEYIHKLGLKAGIYTSPGPLTCQKYEGSYQHEEADARRFAEWGFDFLKYDWCSYRQVAKGKELADLQAPYAKMGAILKSLPRDVVFNLCQYGMGDVWKWGGEVGGHCWRTTGDLGLEKDTRLPGFFSIGFKNAQAWEYAKPGRWNDPDYILIGYVGNARKKGDASAAQLTRLTADEQYSYMSMWSLMSSPLFFSGDMKRLDAFTLSVLTNAEVIDVNQDSLGKQARVVRKTEDEFVLAKPLEDGSVALGLFNLSDQPRGIEVSWADLQLSGKRKVRDLWRQKDEAAVAGRFSSQVAPHGVRMLKLSR
jgi:alpha-galactosidase